MSQIFIFLSMLHAASVHGGESMEQAGGGEADLTRHHCRLFRAGGSQAGARRHAATDRSGLPLQEGDR